MVFILQHSLSTKEYVNLKKEEEEKKTKHKFRQIISLPTVQTGNRSVYTVHISRRAVAWRPMAD